MRILASLLVLLCACEGPAEPEARELALVVQPSLRDAAESFALLLPAERLALRERPDPAGALDDVDDEVAVALALDLEGCVECYRIEPRGEARWVVHGDGTLGALYGLADLLESMGFRFAHPWRTHVPEDIAPVEPVAQGTVEPEMKVRGLHLHTLHPIEAYFALWEEGEENVSSARRIFAWVVANRGNFVHWPGLDDIESESAAERWRAHTRLVLEHAHALGLRAGFGVQLFGAANLQRAFDLVDDEGDRAAQIDARLAILGDLPFDVISLSFGEFSGMPADETIAAIDLVYDAIQARWPGRTMAASIHVGAGEELRVTWMGMDLPYYFLAAHADPAIVPWVHTVMYYDLFEDAGGAYLHQDFAEHRGLLLDLVGEGREVAYFPETAYWVAFDNSVPTYLPLYLRTRFTDLAGIRDAGATLERQVVFSSGWEWGYWQNDVACLRMSHTLPERYEDVIAPMLPPSWGASAITEAAAAIAELADAQHQALIVERLAPWYAGTDVAVELGWSMDIVSQPRRPSYAAVMAMEDAALLALEESVLAPLAAFADASEAALERLRASGVPMDDPFAAELVDGFEIDVARARFAHAALSAVVAAARGASADFTAAEAALERGRDIVARRHARLHHPDPALLVAPRRRTAGLYDHGYLKHADSLCYWERDLAQARNAALGAAEDVPGCLL